MPSMLSRRCWCVHDTTCSSRGASQCSCVTDVDVNIVTLLRQASHPGLSGSVDFVKAQELIAEYRAEVEGAEGGGGSGGGGGGGAADDEI